MEQYLQNFQKDFYEVMGHDCISFAELAKDYGIVFLACARNKSITVLLRS